MRRICHARYRENAHRTHATSSLCQRQLLAYYATEQVDDCVLSALRLDTLSPLAHMHYSANPPLTAPPPTVANDLGEFKRVSFSIVPLGD